MSILLYSGFYILARATIDSDSHWHLRHGKDILDAGFTYVDRYNYTMPSFHYVNHSWLTSVIWSLIYQSGLGFAGLAFLCSIIVVAGGIIATRNLVWIMPLLASNYIYNFGTRSNVVSFLFFTILASICDRYEKGNQKVIFLIPLLLLLWANLHGGFFIGVIFVWGFFFVDVLYFGSKKIFWKEKLRVLGVFIISTCATFLTPYLFDTWKEVFRTINNPLLKQYIGEWQPMTHLTSFGLPLFVILVGLSIWYTHKFRWIEIFTVLLFVQSLISVRMIVFFGAAASFIISNAYLKFKDDPKLKVDTKRLSYLTRMFTIIFTIMFFVEVFMGKQALEHIESTINPFQSTNFLKTHNYSGNIFAPIAWNSYLLWALPQKKVFIDGRMVVWSQPAKMGELSSAFQTYIDIAILEKPYESIFDQFCIGTVFWYNPTKEKNWITARTSTHFINQIKKTNWTNIYEDETAVIYERTLPFHCNLS